MSPFTKKQKQWLWFIWLWFGGLSAVLLLAALIRWMMGIE
ncbi:MAG: DUF2474 domain-containing protein [Thermodesulfobacteriota bacterium]